ncbi:MAG: 30S ribosomal protein S6 [Oscillospiraceae bacterium]
MAKLTESYESIMVLSTTLGEDGLKALVEKFSGLISANGTLDSVEEWGKRKLAYPINDENDGYYVFYNFTSVPSLPAELDRNYRITDGVLRSLIVKKGE